MTTRQEYIALAKSYYIIHIELENLNERIKEAKEEQAKATKAQDVLAASLKNCVTMEEPTRIFKVAECFGLSVIHDQDQGFRYINVATLEE